MGCADIRHDRKDFFQFFMFIDVESLSKSSTLAVSLKCCSGPDVQITSVVKLLNFSCLKCNEKYIYTLYIFVNILIYCVI